MRREAGTPFDDDPALQFGGCFDRRGKLELGFEFLDQPGVLRRQSVYGELCGIELGAQLGVARHAREPVLDIGPQVAHFLADGDLASTSPTVRPSTMLAAKSTR